MNLAFFLVSKSETIYLSPKNTMRQALEKMEHHRYSAIPLIDNTGKYEGTITEGDLLWKLKNTPGLCFENTEKVMLKDIPQKVNNKPVKITSSIEDLISLTITQNFVPVIDDSGIFIGIIRRSDIIEYFAKKYSEIM
ncbi:MAG: inosine-5-monophosphate dehydrogenase [Clostridiales bacterium GWB2_37_7]|nr:MAG: inosine-5-monophosphate dehydrogenase [Clostridiales bacterium GWB2_37_7]